MRLLFSMLICFGAVTVHAQSVSNVSSGEIKKKCLEQNPKATGEELTKCIADAKAKK